MRKMTNANWREKFLLDHNHYHLQPFSIDQKLKCEWNICSLTILYSYSVYSDRLLLNIDISIIQWLDRASQVFRLLHGEFSERKLRVVMHTIVICSSTGIGLRRIDDFHVMWYLEKHLSKLALNGHGSSTVCWHKKLTSRIGERCGYVGFILKILRNRDNI